MNYLFVDRILSLTSGKQTVALKHITASDTYLYQNHQGKIAIISCILGEAIGQLCSWNVIKSSEFRYRLIGGLVGEVIIHGDAYLGETVLLENNIEALDLDNQVVNFHGKVFAGDRLILEVKNGLGPILPIADFSDPAAVQREFALLYRPGEIPRPQESVLMENNFLTADARKFFAFDKILSWETGKKAIAQKNISLTAPYFLDHFPQKPVLPLTLLLESQFQLGNSFIADIIGQTALIKPKKVMRIKMSEFVLPGDSVITHLLLKEHEENLFRLSFRSEVESKRVCSAEVEFEVQLNAMQ